MKKIIVYTISKFVKNISTIITTIKKLNINKLLKYKNKLKLLYLDITIKCYIK